jgi:hypothetical protein
VTLIKLGAKITLKPAAPFAKLLPHGFEAKNKILKEGIEPEKLGAETIG